MYNKELKERFIEHYARGEAMRDVCTVFFDATEPYEIKWGADLCTKTKEELTPMFNDLVGFRARSSMQRRTILIEYVKYCCSEGVENAVNDILDIENLDVSTEKMRQQTVTSPLQLQYYLDTLLEPEDENTIDNIYRGFYWLAFAGFSEEEILQVENGDVDFPNMTIHHKGREYPIYREGIKALRYCVEQEWFNYNHPNYSQTVKRNRVAGRLLLRGIKTQPTSHGFRIALSKKSRTALKEGKTTLKLSYYRVSLSGMFYREYQKELAGLKPDFTEYAKAFMKDKTYKLDSGRNTIEAKERQIVRDYEIDYERWKSTLL